MYNKRTIEDINIYDLNEDELKQIVTNINNKYAYDFNTKITHDLIKEEIQEAINQYTIQQRRDNKIKQIFGEEPIITNKRINISINLEIY